MKGHLHGHFDCLQPQPFPIGCYGFPAAKLGSTCAVELQRWKDCGGGQLGAQGRDVEAAAVGLGTEALQEGGARSANQIDECVLGKDDSHSHHRNAITKVHSSALQKQLHWKQGSNSNKGQPACLSTLNL